MGSDQEVDAVKSWDHQFYMQMPTEMYTSHWVQQWHKGMLVTNMSGKWLIIWYYQMDK